jgi:hypothetical protein
MHVEKNACGEECTWRRYGSTFSTKHIKTRINLTLFLRVTTAQAVVYAHTHAHKGEAPTLVQLVAFSAAVAQVHLDHAGLLRGGHL